MIRDSNSFDFLRLLAAAFVLFSHGPYLWSGQSDWFADETGLATLGMVGVTMFFAISGYWVTASWQNAGSTAQFAANRALRILPGLVVCVILCTFVLGSLATTLSPSRYFSNPGTWEYIRNAYLALTWELPGVFQLNHGTKVVNGSLWTLPIEALAYLSLPALGLMGLVDRRWIWLAIPACLAAYLIASRYEASMFVPGWNSYPIADVAKLFMAFYIGVSLRLLGERFLRWAVVAPLIIAMAWVSRGPWAEMVTIAAVAYVTVLIGLRKIPVLHRAGRFGDFSYGLYLYAFPVQQALAGPWRGEMGLVTYQFECLVVTLIIAVFSWHLVEKPALRLKKSGLLSARKQPLVATHAEETSMLGP